MVVRRGTGVSRRDSSNGDAIPAAAMSDDFGCGDT
ncbi:hypothetical protein Acr_00g0011820 [Actinidia rufa]|uniref:Uncharacterized protein n=1 Tax=Actinidia rufa TaxID=165716 RepID=A0A7J0DAZ5_9ERIC|nr:hypothetical protein Acr_00g0011820 [Actinidia rufa]